MLGCQYPTQENELISLYIEILPLREPVVRQDTAQRDFRKQATVRSKLK